MKLCFSNRLARLTVRRKGGRRRARNVEGGGEITQKPTSGCDVARAPLPSWSCAGLQCSSRVRVETIRRRQARPSSNRTSSTSHRARLFRIRFSSAWPTCFLFATDVEDFRTTLALCAPPSRFADVSRENPSVFPGLNFPSVCFSVWCSFHRQ